VTSRDKTRANIVRVNLNMAMRSGRGAGGYRDAPYARPMGGSGRVGVSPRVLRETRNCSCMASTHAKSTWFS